MHVAVLGAGIIGVTTAYALARRGCKVTIFDRADRVAAGASYANGAQLSYSFVDPMASPSMLKKLPAILFNKDPNSQHALTANPQHLKWGARFISNCTEQKTVDNLERAIRLALESRSALHTLLAKHSISFRHKRAGKLVVTRSAKALRHMKAAAELKSRRGIDTKVLDPSQIWRIEPRLEQHFGDIVGGAYAPDDEVGDARCFAEMLAKICTQDHGVDIRLNQKVHCIAAEGRTAIGVQLSTGIFRADRVVVALGTGSSALLKPHGISVLIEPIKGYSITIPAHENAPEVSLTDADHKLVFARLDSELRIAGLADYDGSDVTLNEKRLGTLKERARSLLPCIGDYEHEGSGWMGARPMTPDGMPLIGGTKVDNLFLNTGHGMLGWTFACGSAERLAKTMLDEQEQPRTFERAAI